MFFIFFLVIQSIFFFLDMCITGFFSFPFFPLTISALAIGCYAAQSYTQCMLLLGPACIHGLFLWGITGAYLGLCIALLLIMRWILNHIHHQQEIVYAIIALYCLYTIAKAQPFLSLNSLAAYTMIVFLGILPVVYFSLKWLIAVKRGNRL